MGPVSAFAARKATQKATVSTEAREFVVSVSQAQVPEDVVALVSPRKKRKREGGIERPVPPVTQRIEKPIQGQVSDQFLLVGKPTKASHEPDVKESSEGKSGGLDIDPNFGTEYDSFESETPAPSAISAQRLSTFVPTTRNVLGETDTQWTIRIHSHDTLAVLGQYDIWIRNGAISILGAVLHASSKLQRVYAPSTHSIPLIRPLPNPYGPQTPVELTIISCGSRLRLLGHVAPKFARIWNGKPIQNKNAKLSVDLARRSFLNMQSSVDDSYTRPLRLLEPPLEWQTKMSMVSSKDHEHPPAIMVCGPKGSGKSTICRMLVNSMLTRIPLERQSSNAAREGQFVALLDLDPGQPEYSPPGEISLMRLNSCNFGPPFTHPAVCSLESYQLIRAHHLGYLSPKEDPNHYLECAIELFSRYQRMLSEYPSCPLIVNCSGWVQGSGLELLVDLIRSLRLTDILYMSTSGPDEVVEALSKVAEAAKTPFHKLPSQPSEYVTRTAPDLRMMQTLSYFHLDEPESGNLRWNPSPLTCMAPLIVHYDGLKQAVFATIILGDKQSPEFFDCILDGCLVGLVVIEDDSAIPLEENKIPDESIEEAFDEESTSVEEHDVYMGLDEEQPGNRRRGSSGKEGPHEIDCSNKQWPLHLSHPSILRTPSGIPYLPSARQNGLPLSPSYSHSLGQALIRSIDPVAKTLHLLTPVLSSTLQSLQEQKRKVVLVRGRLDTPVWAYKEEFELEKVRRKGREREIGAKEDFSVDEVRRWADAQPWAGVVEGGRKGSGKVRKIRRDIRYRAQGPAEMSDV